MLALNRRTKAEQGLLWSLVAMFLGLNHPEVGAAGPVPDALFFYSGAAGIVLVFAVLEHEYDIAYRDELTGLPGRRAFNAAIERLGGTYAIAMCDVDNFKRFNDTYGHDARSRFDVASPRQGLCCAVPIAPHGRREHRRR